ncbi:unnamed protein product [Gordionus sp. m RMFG-2023]
MLQLKTLTGSDRDYIIELNQNYSSTQNSNDSRGKVAKMRNKFQDLLNEVYKNQSNSKPQYTEAKSLNEIDYLKKISTNQGEKTLNNSNLLDGQPVFPKNLGSLPPFLLKASIGTGLTSPTNHKNLTFNINKTTFKTENSKANINENNNIIAIKGSQNNNLEKLSESVFSNGYIQNSDKNLSSAKFYKQVQNKIKNDYDINEYNLIGKQNSFVNTTTSKNKINTDQLVKENKMCNDSLETKIKDFKFSFSQPINYINKQIDDASEYRNNSDKLKLSFFNQPNLAVNLPFMPLYVDRFHSKGNNIQYTKKNYPYDNNSDNYLNLSDYASASSKVNIHNIDTLNGHMDFVKTKNFNTCSEPIKFIPPKSMVHDTYLSNELSAFNNQNETDKNQKLDKETCNLITSLAYYRTLSPTLLKANYNENTKLTKDNKANIFDSNKDKSLKLKETLNEGISILSFPLSIQNDMSADETLKDKIIHPPLSDSPPTINDLTIEVYVNTSKKIDNLLQTELNNSPFCNLISPLNISPQYKNCKNLVIPPFKQNDKPGCINSFDEVNKHSQSYKFAKEIVNLSEAFRHLDDRYFRKNEFLSQIGVLENRPLLKKDILLSPLEINKTDSENNSNNLLNNGSEMAIENKKYAVIVIINIMSVEFFRGPEISCMPFHKVYKPVILHLSI